MGIDLLSGADLFADLDLNEYELKNAVVHKLSTAAKDALVPTEGQIVYDDTLNKLQVYNGTSWVNLGDNGGEGYSGTFSQSIGDGAASSFVVTHNLGTRDLVVSVFDNATYDLVDTEVDYTSTNTITITFSTETPTTNQYRVVIVGAGSTVSNPAEPKEVFSAYRNAAFTPASGVVMVYDAEEYDPANIYDTSTGKFQPIRAGWYRLNWGVYANTTIPSGKYWQATLYKNDAIHKYGELHISGGVQYPFSIGSALVYANGTTDYFTVKNGNDQGSVGILTGLISTFFQGSFESTDYAGGISTPKARVYRTSDQTGIVSGSETAISFSAARYNHGTLWSAGNPTRLTAVVSGIYDIGACVDISSNATGYRFLYLKKNGSTHIGVDFREAEAANQTLLGVTTQVALTAGDYIEATVLQNSGSNRNATLRADYAPELWMSLVPQGGDSLIVSDAVLTALPTNPINGQEITLLLDATNRILHKFKYNASSGSSYKWEAIGGGYLFNEANDGHPQVQSSTYGGAGIAVTIPFAGEWMVNHGGYALVSSQQGDYDAYYLSYSIGGTAAVDADSFYQQASITTYDQGRLGTGQKVRKKTISSADTALTLRTRMGTYNTGELVNWYHTFMKATPVRIG